MQRDVEYSQVYYILVMERGGGGGGGGGRGWNGALRKPNYKEALLVLK